MSGKDMIPLSIPPRRRDLVMVCLLLLTTLALHGHGLSLGFWMDDHNHLELCHENGYRALLNGNRFDWTGRIAHVWWAHKETGWSYFRPLTIAIRVSLFRLFGLDPLPFHVVHLGLHVVTVLLVYLLLRRCSFGAGLAGLTCLFFTAHPAHAFTTGWVANDGPVLVGLWTVLGLLLLHASAQSGHSRVGLVGGAVLCYFLALLSRENGIALGPMLVLFDLLLVWYGIGTGSWRRRLALYAALTTLGVVYLPIRSVCLEPAPLPRSPYFHWPSDPGFLTWLPYKVLNDALCLPLGLPFVPMAEVPWFQQQPFVTVAAGMVVLGVAALLLYPLRRSLAAWGVLAGLILALAPTALLCAMSWNYYLATAGWAVLLALWARHSWPARPRLVIGVLATLGSGYFLSSWGGAWALHAAANAEKCVREEVLATQPSRYTDKTYLFFINLPFFAGEVGPALRLAADRPDLAVYPLTLAPELFAPRCEVIVEKEDDHTLLLRNTSPGWFGGTFGEEVQLGWFGATRRELGVGQVVLRPVAGALPFRVEVVAIDGKKISALRFVFEHRLDDPHYRFFIASRWQFAHPLLFSSQGIEPIAPPAWYESDGPRPRVVSTDVRELDPEVIDYHRVQRMEAAYETLTELIGPSRD
jgi:hypothetical protein